MNNIHLCGGMIPSERMDEPDSYRAGQLLAGTALQANWQEHSRFSSKDHENPVETMSDAAIERAIKLDGVAR